DTRIVPLADIVIQLSPTAVPTRPQQAPVLLGPGSVLLEQGTVEDLIYVVTEGEVEIAPDSAGAGDGLLKIGKPDQYAGQLGPMVRIPRSATVRAPREATVVSYTVDAFRQQFGRPPVPDVPNEPAST
ncbi:cyclic nucleotide-binding domain-containing protein, partial [Mycolicibacter heraklionensis]